MRKVILSLLFSGFGLYAMGQSAAVAPAHQLIPLAPSELSAAKKILPANPNAAGATNTSVPISQWYDNILESQSTGGAGGGNYNTFNNSIFSDSTVQVLYGVTGSTATQLGYCFTQGVGEVFDPQAPIYDSILSLYTTYNVDSVGLVYRYNYVPEVDSNSADHLTHDTLIFQFYTLKTAGLQINTITSTPPQPCAFPKYNYQKNLGVGATGNLATGGVYKYVLGQKDSATKNVGVINVPVINNSGTVGIPVNYVLNTKPKTGYNTDLFAYTVSYRPGFKWNVGDTIDEQYTATPIKHPHSHFKIIIGNSASKDDLSTEANGGKDYEESLAIVSVSNSSTGGRIAGGIRYNKDPNWDGFYLPGTAYNDYNQVLWSQFYVDAPNDAAINQTPNDPRGYILGNVYPNPANGTAKLDFALGNTEQVKITLYDMLGHEVAVLANGQYTSGTHSIAFNTDNLKEGVYLYSINAGSFTKTLKFTVAHN